MLVVAAAALLMGGCYHVQVPLAKRCYYNEQHAAGDGPVHCSDGPPLGDEEEKVTMLPNAS